MRIDTKDIAAEPHKVYFNRCTVALNTANITIAEIPARSLEEALGGFGRTFPFLAERDIDDAYSPENPLFITTGMLTSTNVMTGLRTYFSAYSPLKHSNKGLPSAMWSAGSGKFGSKLRFTGVDEIVLEGRASTPSVLVLKSGDDGPEVWLQSAADLVGLNTHEKIMQLQKQFPDAHFASIGQAGEAWENNRMASVALSTENQLKSGDDKCRYAGRGGMGSMMGYKNVLAIVAQAKDVLEKLQPAVRDVNRTVTKGPGSAKFREANKGGVGGTWTNYEPIHAKHALPENNFRPKGDETPTKMFRSTVEENWVIKAESCWRCGIHCHKNVYRKGEDGKAGAFLAKFDYEPVNLLSTNLGIHDPEQAGNLIRLVDNLGMDNISLGTTVGYVLEYNTRNPNKPLLNGAVFGEYPKIYTLIEQTGLGNMPEIGAGVKRLSEKTGEPGYAMHVKGLELPAYLPDTNPGYPWAIAGGHMSMATFLLLVMTGKTDMDFWVKSITQRGLYQVRDDLLGICKFSGMTDPQLLDAFTGATSATLTKEALQGAVRRAYLRGLKLERKQGYRDAEYALPAEVFENPNPNTDTPNFVTPEFFSDLQKRVWGVFNPEMEALPLVS